MNVHKMVLVPLEKYERMKECGFRQRQDTEMKQGQDKTIHMMTEVMEDKEEEEEPEQKFQNSMDIEIIMQTIPKMYNKKGRTVLDFLQKGNVLSWNKNGEIIYRGRTIHNSHIADLLKDAMREHKGFIPVGKEEFNLGLAQSNVPLLLLENREKRQHVIEAQNQPTRKKTKPNKTAPSAGNPKPLAWISI